MRGFRQRIVLSLKGMAMGAADVVPGVSGGTIAFITGIYEELIDTINRFDLKAVKILFAKGPAAFWKAVNGNFLLFLFIGIGISIVSLAKVIVYLIDTTPIAIWSFFFGLVLASIPLVGRRVRSWAGSRIFAFVAGAVIAYLITDLPPVTDPGSTWYLFFSGMIAICAMILPGISGSFILLLLGSYATILTAVNDRDLVSIGVFAAGAVVGILAFSRFLKFMFDRFHDITIAVLSGFLLGSLNKLWPWKQVLETFTKHAGEPNESVVPLVERNVWPATYEALTGDPSRWLMAAGMAAVGIVLIAGMDRLAQNKP